MPRGPREYARSIALSAGEFARQAAAELLQHRFDRLGRHPQPHRGNLHADQRRRHEKIGELSQLRITLLYSHFRSISSRASDSHRELPAHPAASLKAASNPKVRVGRVFCGLQQNRPRPNPSPSVGRLACANPRRDVFLIIRTAKGEERRPFKFSV
jgi:hypothetical protein